MTTEKKKNPRKPPNNILKYSGMVMQLFVLLMIAVFAGKKIDAYLAWPKPFATILLLFIALTAYLVKLYYDVSRDQ